MIALIPLFGALSDHVGRRPIMIGSLVLFLGLTYPLFYWVPENPTFGNLMLMQIVLCSVLGAFYGPESTALAEQFPTHVRSTGLAIPYNIAVMMFGGFAQFFVTWLIDATGSPIAPAFHVMFGAAAGLLAAFFLVDRAREVRLPAVETR
jgi:MFS transporter, MHS family, proline/betaine transporter